jgi:hypothetical protein
MESKQCDTPSYLSSWLATASDWLDPAELHNHQDQDPTLPFLLSRKTIFPSPTSLYSFALRGKTRVPKRKRSMNSDTASNASGGTTRTAATTTSATSFQNRPVLHPTPPSTRQRSPSPTRKVLSQLKLAIPSLRVCQPDVRLEQPPAVRRLRSMLIMKLSSGVIPHGLKVIVFFLSISLSIAKSIHCRLDSERRILTSLKHSKHQAISSIILPSYTQPHTPMPSGR